MPSSAGLYYFAHVAEDAKANRPPVILIHGAGGNHLSWPPQIRRLPGETIFAIDLPGHGQSEGTGRQSVEAYAEDVILFMQSLKIRSAVIMGISMGSAIALTLALKHPGKVKALALLGGGAKMRVAPNVLEIAGNPNTFEAAVEMINANCFGESAQQNLIELSKQSMLKMRPPVLLGDLLACNTFDVVDQLEKIKKSTIIICGTEDKMTPPKFSESLQAGIANSSLHILEPSGHMVMLEQPDKTADLLKQFLDKLPARRKPAKPRLTPVGEVDPAQQPESNPSTLPAK
jgi:pimeloyl-ACP methyl ester carboxylesterase